MRRTSPRRFVPLATLCAATVVGFVLAAVTKLGDTEESFADIVAAGERGEELSVVLPWHTLRSRPVNPKPGCRASAPCSGP